MHVIVKTKTKTGRIEEVYKSPIKGAIQYAKIQKMYGAEYVEIYYLNGELYRRL